jgi:5-methylcytosine-specific restriction endonuclease McrA
MLAFRRGARLDSSGAVPHHADGAGERRSRIDALSVVRVPADRPGAAGAPCQGHRHEVMEQTLLLNASYEPLKVVHWQKAITLWCQGKVEVIAVHDREIRAVSVSFKLPSVIRLLRFVRIKRRFDYVPFSRANIYARDNHTCQYCRETFPTAELTFDHVVPVAQGGRKDWENIVTCCVTCNRRKGGRTPGEAGMRLLRAPRRPDSAPAIRITVGLRNAPESWRDYLYWNVELDES